MIVAVLLMLMGPQVAERVAELLGVRELFVLLWGWLRFPVALVLLWAALSVVYRYSPAVTQPWRSVWLGAALAVLAWAIASVGFSVYLARFAAFGVAYGSLGAAVGLLIYLNLSGRTSFGICSLREENRIHWGETIYPACSTNTEIG